MVRLLVDSQVTDLVKTAMHNIMQYKITILDDVRRSGNIIIAFSDSFNKRLKTLKEFLNEKLYRHPHMQSMADQAREIIETLFNAYLKDPYKLHGKYKLRLEKEPLEIIISDFIAGMTDRYAYRMYDEIK
jgi:dGTPase